VAAFHSLAFILLTADFFLYHRANFSDAVAQVLKLRVRDYPNPLRQRGIVLLRFTQC
jgi:hypothetical protein